MVIKPWIRIVSGAGSVFSPKMLVRIQICWDTGMKCTVSVNNRKNFLGKIPTPFQFNGLLSCQVLNYIHMFSAGTMFDAYAFLKFIPLPSLALLATVQCYGSGTGIRCLFDPKIRDG